MSSPDRREFLGAAVPFLANLRPVSATEANLDPNLVRLDSGVEPLVRLLEETPRDRVLEEVGARVKKGLNYQELLAALLLAGVRNVQPRPNVGFKFHAVLVVNSAHLASLAAPERERWLPIFWAIDNFKSSQAQTQRESGWRMKPVDEMKLPTPRQAMKLLSPALDNWDEEAADLAVAALARSASANELFEVFARYGCRDFRDIGHKAIYVANAFRTLQTIGWHHAEPVLRSLAYALLQHEGDNPARRDGAPDRPGRRNATLLTEISDDWRNGKDDPAAANELLVHLRTAGEADAARWVVKTLGTVSPRSVWDGLFLTGGELLMRQPGIVALHSLTTLNALRYAYDTSANDVTRRLLLLQAASFVVLFREAMKGRKEKTTEAKIDEDLSEKFSDTSVPKLDEVFATLSKDKLAAAKSAYAYLRSAPATAGHELIDAGRRLLFLKGNDSHDYKFSSAVMEDYSSLSPGVRDRFLAASLHWLKGSGTADAPIVKRVRAALA
jgi:hypothetical protein